MFYPFFFFEGGVFISGNSSIKEELSHINHLVTLTSKVCSYKNRRINAWLSPLICQFSEEMGSQTPSKGTQLFWSTITISWILTHSMSLAEWPVDTPSIRLQHDPSGLQIARCFLGWKLLWAHPLHFLPTIQNQPFFPRSQGSPWWATVFRNTATWL